MLHITCNMCTRDLPDMYALSPRACGPRASGIHIRQIPRAHVTTITCSYVTMDFVLVTCINTLYDCSLFIKKKSLKYEITVRRYSRRVRDRILIVLAKYYSYYTDIPLPTPEEMFSALVNGESYTKLDLARAYKQMKVKEECQPVLTINTHRGLYRYTCLPFGITTAPSLWQRAMAQVLSGIPNVAYYSDDILITGRTRAEHIENLRMVLCRLREYGLRLKHSKCEFFAKDLEFLGHRISPEGVKLTAERIASIRDAPVPTNKKELKSFLGMLTYNARFLPNGSHALHPLNQLLQQNAIWAWKSEHQKAFDAAKRMLSSDKALAHYHVNRPVKLFCDASAYGLGVVAASSPLHMHHAHFPSLNEVMHRLNVRG